MFLAESTITGAGIGTFARGSFAAGVQLGLYFADGTYTVEQLTARTYSSDYAFTDASSGVAVDAADPQSCTARYTNDASVVAVTILPSRCGGGWFALSPCAPYPEGRNFSSDTAALTGVTYGGPLPYWDTPSCIWVEPLICGMR